MRKMILAAIAATTVCGSAQAVDTVTLTLTSPAQVATTAGGTFSFVGTVAASSTNTAIVYFNGDTINAMNPLSFDDSGFYNNLFQLAPGESFTGELFTVSAPAGTSAGTYTGNFTLTGGAIANVSQDTLASQDFSLRVAGLVPEPASWAMMIGGFGMVGAAMRRRKAVVSFA